jgi:predicted dehydrogenase
MLNYGVIGYGYWGPNLVRVLNGAEDSHVSIVCDRDPKRLAALQKIYPAIRTSSDPTELIADPAIDVVVIATPVSTHFPLGLAALQAGKHIFVEKPLASSTQESACLLEEAEKRHRIIFVDHTFVYTGAVRKIRDLIDAAKLGDILYYDSVRVNLGLFQSDVNVIWDLVVHDLAILERLLPDRPTAVSAIAARPIANQPEGIAYVSLYYPGDVIAHIHASWLAPVKVRQTLIGGTKRMIVYNDLDPSEKIKLYDKGVEVVTDTAEAHRMKVGYRSGDMLAPDIDGTEALVYAARHANDCFASGSQPITNGAVGHRIVTILEAADASMRDRGQPIPLAPDV